MGDEAVKYKLINYHCRHCGAPVEPGKERCSYCEQKSSYQRFIFGNDWNARNKVALLIDIGNDFVNFNQISRLDDCHCGTDKIEVTSSWDYQERYVAGISTEPKMSVFMYGTDRTMELMSRLKKDTRYRVRFEINGTITAFETKAYVNKKMPVISPSTLVDVGMDIVIDDDFGWIELEQPKGLTCPNCGAPIISRYGACAYCGGWLEYVS